MSQPDGFGFRYRDPESGLEIYLDRRGLQIGGRIVPYRDLRQFLDREDSTKVSQQQAPLVREVPVAPTEEGLRLAYQLIESVRGNLHPSARLDLDTLTYHSICGWCDRDFSRPFYDFGPFPINLTVCDDSKCRNQMRTDRTKMYRVFREVKNKPLSPEEVRTTLKKFSAHEYADRRLHRALVTTFVSREDEDGKYRPLLYLEES